MIPYPHLVEIWRQSQGSGSEDAYGRSVPGDPVMVEESPAWIQHLTEQEVTDLTEGGAVRTDHLVFMPVPTVGLSQGDALRTLAGGGQEAGVAHQIIAIENPDGTGEHLEVYTIVRKSVEDILQEGFVS